MSDLLKNEIFPAINKALDSIDFDKLATSIGNIISLVQAILPVVNWVVTNVLGAIGAVIANLSPVFTRVKEILEQIVEFVVNVFTFKWRQAFQNVANIVKSVFSGIGDVLVGVVNTVIDVLNRVISWFNGNKETISWARNTNTSTVTPIKKGNVKEGLFASGGTISHGSAIVGENGAELLTMNGGVATVTPINNTTTTNLGGINLSVYGAPGQDINALADVVMNRIQTAVNSKGAVWA